MDQEDGSKSKDVLNVERKKEEITKVDEKDRSNWRAGDKRQEEGGAEER